MVEDEAAFTEALETLEFISPDDLPRDLELIIESAKRGTQLLGKPFHDGSFDFTDESYMESIFEMGEEQRRNHDFREVRPARGSGDSIYLNRAYFGLYSLMGLLKAKIEARRDVV